MSTTVKTGWLKDKNGDKFAPKTLTSQVQTSDGILIEDKIQTDLESVKTYINTKLSELPDPVVNPVSASVGQTIVVKEVDENGKPVKWESADYQPRTHWDEEVEILPETTVEIDPETGIGVIPYDSTVEGGKKYTIVYNGVEYADCECIEFSGMFAIGNLGATGEGLPVTEHPFVIADGEIDYDENGNPILGWLCAALDSSTSVTLSIKEGKPVTIPPRYLPDSIGYSEHELVLPETEGVLDEEQGIYIFNAYISLVVGKTYIVNYCGVPYKCVAAEFGGVPFLGNLDACLGTGNSGEPFALVLENGIPIIMPLSEVEGLMTVSITLDNIVPVPAKYLPDSVGYEELEVMVVETICEVDSDSQSFSFECSFVPEVGATYVINHDGISWECVGSGKEAGDGAVIPYLGNAVFIDGAGSYEPFVLVFHDGTCEGVGDDLSETTKISISKKNVRKIPSKYLPDSMPFDESVELVPETTPIIVEDGNGALFIASDVKFIPNETYEIMYAGTKYTCTAWIIENAGVVAVGNRVIFAGAAENTGEPFVMATMTTDAGIMVVPMPDSVSLPTVSIAKVKVQKISARCLPDNVGGLGLPKVSADDNGAILRVVDGAWAITRLPSVEEEGEF